MRRDGGFALVSVLWIVALLALAALAASAQARRGIAHAHLLEGIAGARALADAGAAQASFALLALDAGLALDGWRTDGSPRELVMASGIAEVAITDQSGLVDLNASEPETLAAVFRTIGLEETEAVALADAVADWRDEDSFARLNGAEAEAYRRAGLGWRPRDGLFETVEELKLVMGMSPDVFDRLAPMVTVHGNRPEVDIAVAPAPVLLATQGGDPDRVRTILALRPTRPLFAEPRTYGIRAIGRTPDGIRFVREAVVRITREPERPLRTFVWRQGSAP